MRKIEVSCPVTATMNIIGGKWKAVILWYLSQKPMRFGELHKIIPKCSLKIYNENLKELEIDGIINREVFAEIPPKVVYSISDYGKTLIPVIIIMREWGIKRLIDNPELMAENDELKYFMDIITTKEDLSFLNKFSVA